MLFFKRLSRKVESKLVLSTRNGKINLAVGFLEKIQL